jgi:hypothetical protein
MSENIKDWGGLMRALLGVVVTFAVLTIMAGLVLRPVRHVPPDEPPVVVEETVETIPDLHGEWRIYRHPGRPTWYARYDSLRGAELWQSAEMVPDSVKEER